MKKELCKKVVEVRRKRVRVMAVVLVLEEKVIRGSADIAGHCGHRGHALFCGTLTRALPASLTQCCHCKIHNAICCRCL